MTGLDHKTAVKNYIKAAVKGVVKTMAKMGISTIQSYRGAQIFEAIGLNHDVIDKYFTWTASRIEGVGLDVLTRRGADAPSTARFPTRRSTAHGAGRRRPVSMAQRRRVSPVQPADDSQTAARLPHQQLQGVQGILELVNDQAKNLCTLRGLFEFKLRGSNRFPIEEVEPVEAS